LIILLSMLILGPGRDQPPAGECEFSDSVCILPDDGYILSGSDVEAGIEFTVDLPHDVVYLDDRLNWNV